MMSILAEECAGSEKRLLTDEQDSYAALGRYFTSLHEGNYSTQDVGCERLVTISIKTIGVQDIPLADLVRLRKRESTFLRELRHNYLKAVDDCLARLSTNTRPGDQAEITRVFEQGLSDDLSELKKALRHKAVGTLLSKEMLVAVLASAGTVLEPWTSTVVSVGALLKARADYRSGREELMRKHAMSWLYQTQGRFQAI